MRSNDKQKIVDHGPGEGFVDNTVYVYKLDEHGEKVLIKTMDPFPTKTDGENQRPPTYTAGGAKTAAEFRKRNKEANNMSREKLERPPKSELLRRFKATDGNIRQAAALCEPVVSDVTFGKWMREVDLIPREGLKGKTRDDLVVMGLLDPVQTCTPEPPQEEETAPTVSLISCHLCGRGIADGERYEYFLNQVTCLQCYKEKKNHRPEENREEEKVLPDHWIWSGKILASQVICKEHDNSLAQVFSPTASLQDKPDEETSYVPIRNVDGTINWYYVWPELVEPMIIKGHEPHDIADLLGIPWETFRKKMYRMNPAPTVDKTEETMQKLKAKWIQDVYKENLPAAAQMKMNYRILNLSTANLLDE